jgi:hypothetical protein
MQAKYNKNKANKKEDKANNKKNKFFYNNNQVVHKTLVYKVLQHKMLH